ncbi:hypothetical protein V8D89_002321 [Ganoderma adspersum]
MPLQSSIMAAKATCYELSVQAYHCNLILSAYPNNPTHLMRLQFSNGLAREMWSVMYSIGILTTANRHIPDAWELPVDGILNRILDKIIWSSLQIIVDISKLDREALVQRYTEIDGKELSIPEVSPLVGQKWWEWPSVGEVPGGRPSWWDYPELGVLHSMPIWTQHHINIGDNVEEIIAIATDHHRQATSMWEAERAHRQQANRAMLAQQNGPEDEDVEDTK